MKCLFLAAGYATRLYPLTENFPKPLLEVAGKPILDWLIDDMNQTGMIDEYIVISNHKFAKIFEEWASKKTNITVIDDGTSSNETRLGAVKDILLAVEGGNKIVNGKLSNCKSLDDDLLVMAGDNLLDFSLGGFIRYAKEKQATCVMRYYEADEARLHKTGVAEIDADGRILSMEEKPAQPKSHWCVPAFYYYTREDAHLIRKGIESGCGTDAPGSFIAWLCSQTCVYAWEMPGKRYDIGSLESYEEVKRRFGNKVVFVTGSAGFIGSNLVLRLLKEMQGGTIVGLDNLNDYYDPTLKEYRLAEIAKVAEKSDVKYEFVKGDLADKALIDSLFEKYHFDVVVNLAAQAGVRYSIENPDAYIQSNMIGFYNILEACRHHPVEHLVYASSSSVYGGNKKVPFSTDDRVDNPVSLYAATKKSNELFAHCYSKLYNIPTTGLRFFTVYGPAGRPDMAYFGFTNKLLKGETIQIFNYGNCRRDFTYVDDIVEGVYRVMQKAPERKNGEDGLPIPPYAVYNIGGGQPENLLDFVNILQEELVRAGVLPADFDFEAHKKLVPMQPGDVPTTYADATALERDFGFTPKITLREGLRKFAEWYKSYYCSDV